MEEYERNPLVKIEHYRVMECDEGEKDPVPWRYWRGMGFVTYKVAISPYEKPSNKGGSTVARVTIDGTEHYATAECSMKDNFCYRTGRELAMLRLYHDLTDKNILSQANFPYPYCYPKVIAERTEYYKQKGLLK